MSGPTGIPNVFSPGVDEGGKSCVSRQLGLALQMLAATEPCKTELSGNALSCCPVPARAIPECQAARYQRAD